MDNLKVEYKHLEVSTPHNARSVYLNFREEGFNENRTDLPSWYNVTARESFLQDKPEIKKHIWAQVDVAYKIASSLGIKVPYTFILPPKKTVGFKNEWDFRFHEIFNWDYIIDTVKLPCYIKPAQGNAGLMVNLVNSKEELIKWLNALVFNLYYVTALTDNMENLKNEDKQWMTKSIQSIILVI